VIVNYSHKAVLQLALQSACTVEFAIVVNWTYGGTKAVLFFLTEDWTL